MISILRQKLYIFKLNSQTVTCETCKFKKHDCFHMQWILKVGLYQIIAFFLLQKHLYCSITLPSKNKHSDLQFIQQILPPEAETLCYKYAHAMKRIQRKESSSDKYEDIIKNLKYDPNKSVAASAKRLCCKILQYKGKSL